MSSREFFKSMPAVDVFAYQQKPELGGFKFRVEGLGFRAPFRGRLCYTWGKAVALPTIWKHTGVADLGWGLKV